MHVGNITQGYEQQIKSGAVLFGALAQTESDCSSHSKAGDLGFFGPGQMQGTHSFFPLNSSLSVELDLGLRPFWCFLFVLFSGFACWLHDRQAPFEKAT